MDIKNFKDLENLVKSNPDQVSVILRYPENQTNFNIINLKTYIGSNIIHLFSRHQPSYLYSIFISNSFQPDFESNNLFFKKNIFGMTWLHILCMYNASYFLSVKDFVTYSLAREQDIVGNTFLHILTRFNPLYLKKVLEYVYVNKNFRLILLKKDILGNTFLHTLCMYHPDLYNKNKDVFGDKLTQIKNKFGKKCTDYL